LGGVWSESTEPCPSGARPFCDVNDGTIFTIAMGLLANWNVNTAFPLH
jgi:hypothetical protein